MQPTGGTQMRLSHSLIFAAALAAAGPAVAQNNVDANAPENIVTTTAPEANAAEATPTTTAATPDMAAPTETTVDTSSATVVHKKRGLPWGALGLLGLLGLLGRRRSAS
jgi:hypothetical protein